MKLCRSFIASLHRQYEVKSDLCLPVTPQRVGSRRPTKYGVHRGRPGLPQSLLQRLLHSGRRSYTMRNVHLHYPTGVACCKLTNEYLATELQTVSTMRNWRTFVTLLEMVDAP